MKYITLLTTKYAESKEDAWLTNEMADSLRDEGCNVSVVAFSWLKSDPPSSVTFIDDVKVIRIKLWSFFYSFGFVGTALKVFLFPFWARFVIAKHVVKCDLVIGNTPCLTILGIPKYFRKRYGSRSYLVLWDFFPFYLKDLGVVRNKISFRLFHYLEECMYRSFDRVGCMTEGNLRFLKEKYPSVSSANVEILPLWAKLKPVLWVSKKQVRVRYGLPTEKVLAVYGGAMSIVQELDNILELARESVDLNVVFLFVGRGTEKARLEKLVSKEGIGNVIFMDYVPRDEYEALIQSCDIGLISLSKKLSVPSFPSKSIDYFKVSLPVLASLDSTTDFGGILQDVVGAGYYALAGDVAGLRQKLEFLVNNPSVRVEKGLAGRKYYEENLSVESAKRKILTVLEGK